MNKLVSICIPVYNTIKYIQGTVECFLNQTYQDIEIIIQDDCSTDGTWELVNKLYNNNPKVRLFRNEVNLGIGANWNEAYDKVKGEYVVIANADDIFYPNFITQGLKHLSTTINFVSFKYYLYFENSRVKRFTQANSSLTSGLVADSHKKIIFTNPYSIVFTIFKKVTLDKIKYKNKLFLNTQVCDFELMIRFSENNQLYYLDTPAGEYRLHSNNNSKVINAELKSFYFDVLPIWHSKFKQNFGTSYIQTRRQILFQYIRSSITNWSKFDFTLLIKMIKYAI